MNLPERTRGHEEDVEEEEEEKDRKPIIILLQSVFVWHKCVNYLYYYKYPVHHHLRRLIASRSI